MAAGTPPRFTSSNSRTPVRRKEEPEVISTSAELARARQQEYEELASRIERRQAIYAYRRRDGALQVLRLRRLRRQP